MKLSAQPPINTPTLVARKSESVSGPLSQEIQTGQTLQTREMESTSGTARTKPTEQTIQPTPPAAPVDDSFEVQPIKRGESGFSLVKALKIGIPAAAGLYAGFGTGRWAGVAGAIALTPALTLSGVIGGAYVGERLLHQSDGTQLRSTAIGAGAGLVAGIAGGYLLGSRLSNPALAVALGLVGGATSAVLSKLKS